MRIGNIGPSLGRLQTPSIDDENDVDVVDASDAFATPNESDFSRAIVAAALSTCALFDSAV